MAEQVVELTPGESQLVSFEAIPTVARTYSVSVDGLTGSFKAVAKPTARFLMPAQMDVVVTNGSVFGMYWTCEFSVVITNQGDAPGTHTINWWDNCGVVVGSRQITLQPGEDYLWSWSQWIDFRRLPGDYGVNEYIMNLEGDWEQDNLSKGTARP